MHFFLHIETFYNIKRLSMFYNYHPVMMNTKYLGGRYKRNIIIPYCVSQVFGKKVVDKNEKLKLQLIQPLYVIEKHPKNIDWEKIISNQLFQITITWKQNTERGKIRNKGLVDL